jgi:hypothetical protein
MNPESPSFWVDPDIFDWTPEYLSGTRQDRERVFRPHQILDHAYRLLAGETTAFIVADALSNLRRAVNNRLQHLEELYNLSSIFPKSIGALERLEGIDVAKPFLIRALFDLRNDVEHNDGTPPSQQRCSELADATWYFLKTTDYACKTVVSGVTLRCESGAYARDPDLWLIIELQPASHSEVLVRGCLPALFLHEKPLPGSLPLVVHKQRGKSSPQYSDGSAVSADGLAINGGRGDDERFCVGSIVATDALVRKLWALALQTL